MPSIAQSPIEVPSRKRRREDENHSLDLEIQMKLSSPRNGSSFFPSNNESHHSSHNSNTEFPHTQSRRLKPIRFTPHDLKRQRVEHEQPALHIFPRSDELQNFKAGEMRKVKAVLDPCHICHRKPTVRSDLDSYADCEGCGERACYICIRECMGPGSDWTEQMAASFYCGNGDLEQEGESRRIGDEHGGKGAKEWGHRRMVCSRCCVERGTEGEVCCLGCLRREEDG